MALSKIAIKRRIRSVSSTLAITKAMELVAASKLQRQRNRMLQDKVYADLLYAAVAKILSGLKDNDAEELAKISPYLAAHEGKSLVIVFGADNGLCGAYNVNLAKYLEEELAPGDLMIPCGNKIVRWCRKNGFSAYREYPEFDRAGVRTTNEIADAAMKLYDAGQIARIRVIYSEYINSVSFVPTAIDLLPIDRAKVPEAGGREIIFDPSPQEVLGEIVPLYIRNLMYSLMIRSKTSEQASRRMAMQTATDNARDLADKLTLEYNKARQAAITQEITEISSNELGRGNA